jgi:DNA-binding phage protein
MPRAPMPRKPKKALPFDAANYLDSEEAVVAYIEEAFTTEDADTIFRAICVAERVRRARSKASSSDANDK